MISISVDINGWIADYPLTILNDQTDEQEYSDRSAEERRDAKKTLEELLACAEASVGGASPPSDPEEWCQVESESLLRWAENTGRLLSSVEFNGLIAGFKLLAGGLEHDVFYRKRGGRVVKVTKAPKFGAMWELRKYVRNLIWSNDVFEDDIRLEGVILGPDGVSVVISQPYIIGTQPTIEQIADWFAQQGFQRISTLVWENPSGCRIADAHTGNFILMNDGALIPIDLHVERRSPSEHL